MFINLSKKQYKSLMMLLYLAERVLEAIKSESFLNNLYEVFDLSQEKSKVASFVSGLTGKQEETVEKWLFDYEQEIFSSRLIDKLSTEFILRQYGPDAANKLSPEVRMRIWLSIQDFVENNEQDSLKVLQVSEELH